MTIFYLPLLSFIYFFRLLLISFVSYFNLPLHFSVLIVQLTGITADRLSIVSVDTVSGNVLVNILPQQSNEGNLNAINTTMYSSTFAVTNMLSVTQQTAEKILQEASVPFAVVTVDGPVVTFTSASITSSMLAGLANITSVNASTMTAPGGMGALIVPLIKKFKIYCI